MRATLREVEVLTGVSWSDRAMQAERELAAVRDECAALRREADTLRREHGIVTSDLFVARQTRDRYERGLRAMASKENIDKWCEALLTMDVIEWVQLTATALLDGQEAECPVCSTHVHEGACVGDGDDE